MNFLEFLLRKHKETGKTSFTIDEYMDFVGYEDAVDDLSRRGIIHKENNIVDTITMSDDLLNKLNG